MGSTPTGTTVLRDATTSSGTLLRGDINKHIRPRIMGSNQNGKVYNNHFPRKFSSHFFNDGHNMDINKSDEKVPKIKTILPVRRCKILHRHTFFKQITDSS